jgi:hypothetical protein
MIGKFSLGKAGLIVGGALTALGLWAYIEDNATLNLVGFFYGIPLVLGGLALKAGELEPVPFSVPTSPDVLALREQQATETQTKLRKDITRFQYGQSVHLDETLKKLGLNPGQDACPDVQGLREEDRNGAYTLVLEFNSPEVPLKAWQDKHEKLEKYFGPNIQVALTQPNDDKIEVAFIKRTEA